MNRYTALACLGFGLMVSPLLGRFAESATPGGPKIGIVDMERVMSETGAGKRASAAFDADRKKKQAELDKSQKDLQDAAKALDKQSAVLKPDVLAAKKGELEKQYVALQQTYVKLEKYLSEKRTELIQTLLKQASPIIAEMAKSEGFTVIFDQNAAVWVDPAIDLTEKLSAKMK
jgi:outer membrane protein